jgi:hypothetical protein
MTPFEETAADYAATHLTSGPHVMAHLRAALAADGVKAARERLERIDGVEHRNHEGVMLTDPRLSAASRQAPTPSGAHTTDWNVGGRERTMRRMSSPVPSKWYHRPFWVLVLLFAVLGPFGLPYLWKSPGFSRHMKIVLTVLVFAYMGLFVNETIHVLRLARSELDVLGALPL